MLSALLAAASGLLFLPPLAGLWLLPTSTLSVEKRLLDHSLSRNTFAVFMSLRGSVADCLSSSLVQSSHVGKNDHFGSVTGEFRQRTGESWATPETELPRAAAQSAALALRFSSAWCPGSGSSSGELYWGLERPLGQTSTSSLPDLSASFLVFSTLQLPLAPRGCFSWPYLATVFFFSSLFFLFFFLNYVTPFAYFICFLSGWSCLVV